MGQAQLARAYDEVVTFFATGPSRDEIQNFRLSDETVARVRELLARNSAGAISADDAEELDECVQIERMISLIRSRARLARQNARGA